VTRLPPVVVVLADHLQHTCKENVAGKSFKNVLKSEKMYIKVLKRDKTNVSAKYNFLHTLGYYCLCFLYYDFPILKYSHAALPIYFK